MQPGSLVAYAQGVEPIRRALVVILEHQAPVLATLSFVAALLMGAAGFWVVVRFLRRAASGIVGPILVKTGETPEAPGDALKAVLRLPRRAKVVSLAVVLTLAAGASYGAYRYGQTEPLSPELLIMPPPTCARGDTLVLFIHGWRGHPRDTWNEFPHLVCQDAAFKNAEVLSIGYPIFLIGANPSMEETASWLADKLAANGVSRYRKIAVVAHSIGGLLARRMVLEQRPELRNIGLLIEVGTPHHGPASYTKFLSESRLKGGRLVKELQPKSAFLTSLETSWPATSGRPATHCWGSPNDGLVSMESAQATCDKVHTLPLFDHSALVKPSGRSDDRYTIPMNEVRKYLNP